ncbi:MAG: PAS domain S-box protein [Acidobacteria bacterium]|nr:PAS domain S-box protein [Acidobacteriota bacterium]
MSLTHRGRRKMTLPSYEQPYEALFEQTNDAVVILDPDGTYQAANKRATDMLGYPLDELVGLSLSKIVKPDEYDDAMRRMAALLADQSVPIYERRLIRKDGTEISVDINASLVRDELGRPAYFQVVARDISDRKREERALQLIAEGTASGTDATFFQAAVRHLVQTLEVRCACITECTGPAPARARVMAWWWSETRDDTPEYEVAGTPSEEVFKGNLVFQSSGVRQSYPRDPLLAELGAESYLGIPLRDPSGEVIGHLAVIDDKPMSEDLRDRAVLRIFASRVGSELARRRADKKREESEIRYKALVEQLPAVTYAASLDPEAPTLYVSPQIETVLGFTVDEFYASPSRWRRQLHPDDRDAVLEKLSRALEGDTPFRTEYRIYRKDGSLAWARDEAVVVRGSDGSPLFLQGIMLDVTVEKRLTEELLNARKLESVGMLAGGIAHDFNNSLMGILGNLSIAKSRVGKKHAAYGRLREAEKAALRAKGLTRQLLTFSKGGAPVRRTTSIEGVIRDTVQFVLSGSNVRGQVIVEPGLWPAEVDAGQISQVIENLVLNAVQAMPDGGLVQVEADNVDVPAGSGLPVCQGCFVRIRVSDEGIGIPPEAVDRIFDPYFTTKEHGSGLGLATSYAIVQKHEGHLAVRSRQGGGTEFTLHLPAGKEVERMREENEPVAAAHRGHVLVMDDDDLVRDTIGAMLAGLGHSAEFASDGESAVQAYRSAMQAGRPFDAVILDLTIRGGYGGEEAMRRLLEIDPGAVGIVSSGYSESPVMAEAHRFGFRDCIAKPYRPTELGAVLDRVLGSND